MKARKKTKEDKNRERANEKGKLNKKLERNKGRHSEISANALLQREQ